MESCLKKLSFCLKTAIFGGGNMVVLPLQDPQGFPGMAHLGPKSYPQVSSEKLKKNVIFILNLVPINWVSVQKQPFFWEKWGRLPPSGSPRFAGHGSFGLQILPTSVHWEWYSTVWYDGMEWYSMVWHVQRSINTIPFKKKLFQFYCIRI